MGGAPALLLFTLSSGALAVGVGAALTARYIVRPLLNVEKELMADVAHELRTPLSRLRVALEIAGEGNAATAKESLEEIAVDLSELEVLLDDVLAEAPLSLNADAVLLRRALDNLLENADKYSPDPDSPIALSLSKRGQHARFAVEDRGIGIAAADLERVFSPFFRAERSRSRNADGVGLGLTLAKPIVEAHGGRIRLVSKAGVGTAAEVELPTL
ncbi:MAG TPA: HAMP domain-containing sensor histidine kinase [Polyangiaceae bacterium]|nr:HAMP domain-containing sensor histidine kinase [Polyangiaceae bacterium]